MENIKLSAPWTTFCNEIVALFENDLDIKIRYDDVEKNIKLFVSDAHKAEALAKILPAKKKFGNVVVTIDIVPANDADTITTVLNEAFRGNPAVQYIYDAETPFGPINYVVFKNKVVQFYNDQIDDINGNKNTLYQEIAKDVFEINTGDRVFFCTDAPAGLSKPLGEWP